MLDLLVLERTDITSTAILGRKRVEPYHQRCPKIASTQTSTDPLASPRHHFSLLPSLSSLTLSLISSLQTRVQVRRRPLPTSALSPPPHTVHLSLSSPSHVLTITVCRLPFSHKPPLFLLSFALRSHHRNHVGRLNRQRRQLHAGPPASPYRARQPRGEDLR